MLKSLFLLFSSEMLGILHLHVEEHCPYLTDGHKSMGAMAALTGVGGWGGDGGAGGGGIHPHEVREVFMTYITHSIFSSSSHPSSSLWSPQD